MIVPTPEYDPLFARDGAPFQVKMLVYIQREFADILGPRTALLSTPEGLNQLAAIVNEQSTYRPPRQKTAA